MEQNDDFSNYAEKEVSIMLFRLFFELLQTKSVNILAILIIN